LAVQAF
jgi:hypothetical protein